MGAPVYTDGETMELEFVSVPKIESFSPDITMLGDTSVSLVVDDETEELVGEDSLVEPGSDAAGLDSSVAGVGLDDSLVDWAFVVLVWFDPEVWVELELVAEAVVVPFVFEVLVLLVPEVLVLLVVPTVDVLFE